VGFLWNRGDGTPATALEGAARGPNVSVQLVEIRRRNDLNQAFAEMVRQRVHGIVVAQEPITLGSRRQVVQLAAASRLPAMYALKEFTDVGGLMSYGPNIADQFRRAAVYVDKILRGAKPGDLPVDQAARFELAINVKAAKTLGLTIPPSLLARADQVIE
jgi:putative ABC transport system substrate-binding protein